jgi:hypothetical protein
LTPGYRPGDQALLREVWQGKVWAVRPVTVVRDKPDLVALHIAHGTMWKRPVARDGRRLRLPAEDWWLEDAVWQGSTLRLTRPCDAHSVEVLRDAAGRFVCWYINIEEPMRRSPLGFDYMDHALDIVVSPDLARWRWKDEDELAEGVAKGVFSADQARAIRAEGERALERLLAREPPLDEPWQDWRPDPAWPVPALPAA